MEVLLAVWAMDPGRVGLAGKVRSMSGNWAIPTRSYPGEADSIPRGHKTPEAGSGGHVPEQRHRKRRW